MFHETPALQPIYLYCLIVSKVLFVITNHYTILFVMTNYYTVLFSNKLLHKYIIIGFSAAGNNPTSGRAHLSIWVLAQFG